MSVVGSYPSTMMTAFMQPEEEGSAIVSGCPGDQATDVPDLFVVMHAL